MSEFKLDKKQKKAPIDFVREKSADYDTEYKNLESANKELNSKLKREIIRSQVNGIVWFLRVFVCSGLAILFLLSNILYSGLFFNRVYSLIILALVGFTLVLYCVSILLAILCPVRFRGLFIIAGNMLMVDVLLVCLMMIWATGMICYVFVLIATSILWGLNAACFNKGIRFKLKPQIIKSAVAIIVIAMFLSGVFIANAERIEDASIWYDRELYSRFAMYSITKTQDGETATFNGLLLTAKDILGGGDSEVYEVEDALSIDSMLFNSVSTFIKDDIFNGNDNVGKGLNNIKNAFLKFLYNTDLNIINEVKVLAVGSGAFRDATSINKVVLPESVTQIAAGAFDGSAVMIVEVYAPEIHIDDNLEGSSVRVIKLLSSTVAQIDVKDPSTLSDGITFSVPANLVAECRELNPELADYIIEIVE